MTTGYVDIHTHYDDDIYGNDVDGTISRLFRDDGLIFVGGSGVDVRTSKIQLELAERFEGFYACVGIHPGNVSGEILEEALGELEKMLSHPKCVAIGEIGLDYHYEGFDKELQKKFFISQMELAGKSGKPVIIHDRDAHGDCMEIVRLFPDVKGVFHSFSGSVEMANELVSLGWYISFSGVVTFKNARKTVEAAGAIPERFILTETDCPYLTPVPFRGTTNYSGMVKYTLEKIAEIRNTDVKYMADVVYENTKRFFFGGKEMQNDRNL